MRIRRFFAALLAAVTVAAFGSIAPQPAAAATDSPITIAITATVDEVQDWAHAMGTVQPGDIITGFYTYNAAMTNLSQYPGIGSYRHTTAPYGIRLYIGGKVVETDPEHVLFTIAIQNNVQGWDAYSVYSERNMPVSDVYTVTGISWWLNDPTQTALKNISLTKSAPTLSAWQQSSSALTVQGIAVDPNSDYEFYLKAHVTQAQKVTR